MADSAVRSTPVTSDNIASVFTKRKLDDAALEELEETLIVADIGVSASQRIVQSFRRNRFGKEVTAEEVKAALAEEITAILAPVAQPLVLDPARRTLASCSDDHSVLVWKWRAAEPPPGPQVSGAD